MDSFQFFMGALVSVSTLMSMGVVVFVAWIRQTMRAELATLSQIIIDRQAALVKQAFETHYKDHERIDKEVIRLRDFKHDAETLLREHDTKLHDLKSQKEKHE